MCINLNCPGFFKRIDPLMKDNYIKFGVVIYTY